MTCGSPRRLIKHTKQLLEENEEKLCIKVLQTLREMMTKDRGYGEKVRRPLPRETGPTTGTGSSGPTTDTGGGGSGGPPAGRHTDRATVLKLLFLPPQNLSLSPVEVRCVQLSLRGPSSP